MKYKQRTCSLHRSLGLLRSLLLLMVMTMWTSSGWANVIDATLEETAASCVGNSTSAITNTHNTAAEHFNNYNGNNTWSGQAYMKFSFEIPSGHTVTSATLTFNTHQGGRKGDRNNTVYHVTAADFDFTAFDGADRVSIPTNTTIGTVVTNDQGTAKDFLNLTMNVTNAVLTQVAAEKNYIILMLSNHGQSADLYGKGSTDKAPTLVITTADASATTSYTILCKYGETEIGRYEHTGFAIGENFTASADEMAAITKDNVKYIYESGNTTQKAVANAESNVITLTYREAASYNYSIATSLGETLKEGSDFEGNSVTYYWPYYQVSEGTLYKGPKNSSNPWFGKTFTLDENNKAETVSYTATETTGIVFLKEAEAIETLTPATNGNIQIRCAGGYGAYGTNAKITTLTPGHYKVTGACYSNTGTKFTFNIGEVTVLEFNGNGGWGEFPSDEFMLPFEADLTFTGGSANYALDFVYIQKTADLSAEEIAEIEAQATNKQALKDKIQEAKAIDTTGKNGADDLAAAITAAEAVKDAASKTAAEYAAATQALQDAIDAFNAANPEAPVATWRDIKIDLTNGNLLEESEKVQWGNVAAFGIAVAEDGTVSRVAADAANAACVVSGKWHSNQCWASVNITVNVEGPVKVTSGTQPWSDSPTTVKVGDETVASFSNKGTIWTSTATGNVVSGYYKGTEAATLTIDGGGYPTYIAIEAVDPADIPSEATLTFDKGTAGAEGTAPAAQKVETGSKVTIPANTSLYIEGQTLTGWTDGENEYKAGDEVTVNEDITLTPVFTENTVSLSDRTEAVTLNFDLEPATSTVNITENQTGVIVTQATVKSETIDVAMKVDNTYGEGNGKLVNAGRESWCQANANTKMTVPSAKNATVEMKGHGNFSTTTVDGQTDYEGTGTATITATVASSTETVDIILGSDCGYLSYVKVTLPAIEQQGDVVSYDNEAATITWAGASAEGVATPKDGFKLVTLTTEHLTSQTTATPSAGPNSGLLMLQFTGDDVADGNVQWIVQPAKGLTFTPTKVSGRISRFATDGITMDIVVLNDEGTTVTLAEGLHPTRNNKTQADDKWGGDAKYAYDFNLNVPATLATTKGFTLKIVNSKTNRQVGFADIKIEGTVDGTIENVAKYTLTTATNIEEAGSVSVYPVSAEYEEGSEVKLTATENFGYDFVNWTDADNQVVSENAVFTYTMNANATLTANFQAVETYELALTIAGGANDYMVHLAPAPTVVEDKLMYEAGTAVTMTASSNSILTFTGWDGDVTGTLLENTVTMNADKAVTANFSCKDYIVAWDFVKAGNNGRLADFASKEENASAALVLRQEDGTTNSWLDKSLASQAAGYDGFAPNGAAVNWKAFADKYYFQTKVNASEFVNIKVLSKMQYQASAYKKQLLQYSLDGTEWTTLGNCTFAAIKTAYDLNGELPETANHAESLYLRWIPDYTSEALGSGNDGTALGQIYILGDMAAVDDGQAPALVTSVPTNEATGISAAGNIVLTFSEKVKLTDGATATLGGKTLEGIVSNTTIMFPYKGLDYDQPYTFALAKECVEDLYGNTPTEDITIDFTTMVRPSVTKGAYDAVVSDGEELKAAISEANSRSDKTTRYRIFLKKGEYVLPLATTTRDYSQDVWDGVTKDSNNKPVTEKQKFTLPDATTYITAGNISFIGEDRDQTVITNGIEMTDNLTYRSAYTEVTSKYEGIGQSDVLQIKANGLYFQDVTVKTAIGDKHGRDIAIHDYGTQNIYKNVNMHGYQDTWVSDKTDGKYYVEGGIIRGRTDFICGSGDMFINQTDIIMCENGGYVVAPRSNEKYGYVFKDCTLKGSASDVNGNYWLGRAWTADAETYFINTTMEAQPRGAAWKEWNNGPTRFAEYNSKTAAGAAIDLSSRATIINGSANNPVLTDAEAMEIGNMANTFGEWQPQLDTEQAPVPTNVMLTDATLTWTDSNYALLWAIVKDGKVVDFTTKPTYTVTEEGTYAVRAANEMGGLSEASEGVEFTAIADVINSIDKAKAGKTIYNLQGVRVKKAQKGLYIINGKKTLVK